MQLSIVLSYYMLLNNKISVIKNEEPTERFRAFARSSLLVPILLDFAHLSTNLNLHVYDILVLLLRRLTILLEISG